MRVSKLSRETRETQISVEVNLDGRGEYEIDTGNGMFDHLLAQLSRHGLIDLKVHARGDTHVGWHHLVEDTGIVMGRALKDAVGDASGIPRMAHSYVPLDEALALTVVDFGGRGVCGDRRGTVRQRPWRVAGGADTTFSGDDGTRGRVQPACADTGGEQQPSQGGGAVQEPRAVDAGCARGG